MNFPLKKITVGKITTENNVFAAPLAGYTNFPMREIFYASGAGLCFTEMISAKGLKYGSENTKELLYTDETETPKAVQIFGSDPDIMRWACESEDLSPFDIVDINMGCPVPKIYKNGEGSALLENPVLAEKIVSECVKSGKTVTVKFRIGLDEKRIVAEEFGKRMAGAGASLLTAHGRVKNKFYAGEVNYDEIAKVKNAVSVPVVANGGVFSVEDGVNLMEKTGADGIMIARATMYDPQIFCDFTGVPRQDTYLMIEKQSNKTQELFGDRFALVFMRKMVAFYLRGMRGASAYKERLFQSKTTEETLAIAREIFQK